MSETEFGAYLRRRMRAVGISQVTLAARAGISRQGLVKLLNGEVRSPEIATIHAIASVLGVSPIYLLRLLRGKSVIDREIATASAVRGDHSSFVSDVTAPNGTLMKPGERFEKIWRIQNSGDVRWAGRRLRCVDERAAPGLDEATRAQLCLVPEVPEIAVSDAAPGDVVDLSVWFTAPTVPATCVSIWKMVDADGKDCFPRLNGLNVVIVVTAI